EDALFEGPPGTGKSHLAQAIGHAVIQQGYRVLYRETHKLLEELADATLDGSLGLWHQNIGGLTRLGVSVAVDMAIYGRGGETAGLAFLGRKLEEKNLTTNPPTGRFSPAGAGVKNH